MLLLIFLVVIRLPAENYFCFETKYPVQGRQYLRNPVPRKCMSQTATCDILKKQNSNSLLELWCRALSVYRKTPFFIDQYIPTKGRSYKHKLLILFKRGLFALKSNKIFLVLTQVLSIGYDKTIISDCLDFLLYIPIIL